MCVPIQCLAKNGSGGSALGDVTTAACRLELEVSSCILELGPWWTTFDQGAGALKLVMVYKIQVFLQVAVGQCYKNKGIKEMNKKNLMCNSKKKGNFLS